MTRRRENFPCRRGSAENLRLKRPKVRILPGLGRELRLIYGVRPALLARHGKLSFQKEKGDARTNSFEHHLNINWIANLFFIRVGVRVGCFFSNRATRIHFVLNRLVDLAKLDELSP